MTESDEDDEYCAVCGDSEFDTDGEETHVDEEYDHDFEYEEEPTTLEDVKEFADTVKSLAEAGKAVKEVLQPSKIDSSELTADRFKQERFKIPPIEKVRNLELGEHPDVKVEKRHKETIKWAKIAIIAGIIVGIVAIVFN